jgi:hypothetical protein
MSDPGTLGSTEFQLPHRVLRKLLRGRWRRRARNVLVVAHHCTDLVRHLNRRGIHAVGIDDQTAGDRQPTKVHFGSVAGGFPYPPHQFDLVLVGNCRTFEGGLSGPEPLIAMANLLSSLRSKSRLVWLNPVRRTAQPAGTGSLVENLSQFPCDIAVSEYHDGWERFLSLEWLLGRQRHVQLQLLTITVPGKPFSRLQWHQHARDVALSRPPSASRAA